MNNDNEYVKTMYDHKSHEEINCIHVLLVDDEYYLVKLWKNVLEKRGYLVSGYTDGNLALEEFKLNPESFDIVITDQYMPNMTGNQLAASLIKIRSDIKIIVCTGYIDEFNIENAIDMGICEFLLKPFDNCTLINAISRNL